MKATIEFTWWKKKQQRTATKIDVDIKKPEDTGKKREYQKAVRRNYLEDPKTQNTQRQWGHIVKSCLNAGKDILGKKERGKKHEDQELERLAVKQKNPRKSNKGMSREKQKNRTEEKKK